MQTRKWTWRLSLLIILALALLSCGPGEEEQAKAVPAVPVQVLTVTATDLPLNIEPVGRLAADREVTLAAEVSGRVESYEADMGDPVEAGAVLVRADPTDYELAVQEAEAAEASAKAQLEALAKTYQRMRGLLSREVIAQDEFDRAEAEYKAAAAQVKQAEAAAAGARERLAKCEIKAPFAGHVAARLVEKGQSLMPGQSVMTIADLSRLRVRVFVNEKDIVRIDPDDPVVVMVEALQGAEFPGRIDRIGIKADEQTNTFAVEAVVENPDRLLVSGLTVRVRLTASLLSDAIFIPQSALLFRQDRREVYVAGEGGKAELRVVETGLARGESIQVVKGLNPGDRLVVNGAQYLTPGALLNITGMPEPEPPTQGAPAPSDASPK